MEILTEASVSSPYALLLLEAKLPQVVRLAAATEHPVVAGGVHVVPHNALGLLRGGSVASTWAMRAGCRIARSRRATLASLANHALTRRRTSARFAEANETRRALL
jgi:hypothetical protein